MFLGPSSRHFVPILFACSISHHGNDDGPSFYRVSPPSREPALVSHEARETQYVVRYEPLRAHEIALTSVKVNR